MYWESITLIPRIPRHIRIEKHRQRILREMPAFDFMDQIQHDFDRDELVERLEKVKTIRKHVEGTLQLAESQEFLCLLDDLNQATYRYKIVLGERAAYLTEDFKRRGKGNYNSQFATEKLAEIRKRETVLYNTAFGRRFESWSTTIA